MVICLNEQVGVLANTLLKLRIYDNTLILYTSVNGPLYNGGTDSPWFSSGAPPPVEYGRARDFYMKEKSGFR